MVDSTINKRQFLIDNMEKRHKIELNNLDLECKALFKNAKKSNRNEIEARIIQMKFDLKGKHREEEDLVDSGEDIEDVNKDNTIRDDLNKILLNDTDALQDNLKLNEEDKIALKKAKSKKKQDKKKNKIIDVEAIKQQIQLSNSGPSMRDIELSTINSKLKKESLQVKPILSDGNCLYRAIADQILFTEGYNNATTTTNNNNINNNITHEALRSMASIYIKNNPDEFCPFLGFIDGNDPLFKEYCNKVESNVFAEWGGELELKALSNSLKRNIHIYSANSSIIMMNYYQGNIVNQLQKPLILTFHQHYYSLGEHYNSVMEIMSDS